MINDYEALANGGMSADQLASTFFNEYYKDKTPIYPINPFQMLKDMGILFSVRPFKNYEGVYIPPEDDNDIPTDGPCVGTYETYEDDYEEVCMNVLRANGRMIKEPTDAFIVTVLANNKNEAVELATNAYNEFYGI